MSTPSNTAPLSSPLSSPSSWNIFGSPSSTDCDVFIPIDKKLKPLDASNLCLAHKQWLTENKAIDTDRELNVNVGIIKDSIITWVYKGTPDETNNSIFT